MYIRWKTNPPRICWKEKVGGEWKNRTASVTRKNLLRHGVGAPAPGKAVTDWHVKRLLSVLQRLHSADLQPAPSPLSLAGAVELYLESVLHFAAQRCRRQGVGVVAGSRRTPPASRSPRMSRRR